MSSSASLAARRRATLEGKTSSPTTWWWRDQPTNLYGSLCERGDQETGKLACSADSEDCRGRTHHDFSLFRLMGYHLYGVT
jgi:hypothetical protein